MVGIVMQNLRRIQKLNGATALGKMRLLCEPVHREVRSKSQGKAHHAL
jgi:hypothetical protein